jgi:hypothetical protein
MGRHDGVTLYSSQISVSCAYMPNGATSKAPPSWKDCICRDEVLQLSANHNTSEFKMLNVNELGTRFFDELPKLEFFRRASKPGMRSFEMLPCDQATSYPAFFYCFLQRTPCLYPRLEKERTVNTTHFLNQSKTSEQN